MRRTDPVLWRPFHESDGDWFWWGAKGPETARELYKLMIWSKEFIIGEKYNSVGNLRRMYSSSYAIQGKGLIK